MSLAACLRLGLMVLMLTFGGNGPVSAEPAIGGQRASLNGQKFEALIEQVLSGHGMRVVGNADWVKSPASYAGDLLIRNAPYTNIYGSPSRSEFLLISERLKGPIRIEAKWQQSRGSVDEKLPFLYRNAVLAMPEATVFIVIDGPGWRHGAVDWLKRAAETRLLTADDRQKTVRVFSFDEFSKWAEILSGD